MKILSTEQLEVLNEWEPLASNFGRFNRELFDNEIYPLIKKLENDGFICEILNDGGMSTFLSLSISEKPLAQLMPHPNESLDQFASVHFCLLGPWVKIGNGWGWDFNHPENKYELAAKAALEGTAYRPLTKSECEMPVPTHIKPIDITSGNKEYQVINVLFQADD